MKILACVFNEIDFDGRVQRGSAALGDIAQVDVVSLDSGHGYQSAKFRSVVVKRPARLRSQIFGHVKAWLFLWRHAVRERPDVVHAHDCFMAFPGWVAAKLSRSLLAYDAHELVIPEPAVKMSIRDRIWYWLERWTIVHADLVIAANDERAEVMVRHYRLAKMPLVIQNIPPRPESLETSAAALESVKRANPQERLIVYQGDVDVRRGIQRFVEAFPYLPPHYKLVIIGGGPSVGHMAELAKRHNIEERVVFVKRIPRESLPGLLHQCDAGIVCYSYRSLDFLLCAPNKIYEYAQVGLPMILTDQPPLKRIVGQSEIGTLVTRDDTPEAIAAAIAEVVEHHDHYKRKAEIFAAANDWEVEAQKLRSGILSLANQHP